MLFSTHVMSEAEKLCDTIGIIHGGCLKTEGTLAELRARSGQQDLEDIFVRTVAIVSWRNIGVVYRKELTDSLRDRRTVISMVAGADSADAAC